MTGLCTNLYRPPAHVIASGALLRLASPFFHAGHFGADDPNRPINYGCWLALRETAQKLLERGSLELNYNEAYLLDQALRLCPDGADVQFIHSLTFTDRGSHGSN